MVKGLAWVLTRSRVLVPFIQEIPFLVGTVCSQETNRHKLHVLIELNTASQGPIYTVVVCAMHLPIRAVAVGHPCHLALSSPPNFEPDSAKKCYLTPCSYSRKIKLVLMMFWLAPLTKSV